LQFFKDQIPGARICNLFNRQDQGYGFSMRGNEQGPHQITSVEEDSPAKLSGLLNNDLVLKVNDVNVVGERYSKTITMIKNESEKGRLKLEVIQPHLCPDNIQKVLLFRKLLNVISKRNQKIQKN